MPHPLRSVKVVKSSATAADEPRLPERSLALGRPGSDRAVLEVALAGPQPDISRRTSLDPDLDADVASAVSRMRQVASTIDGLRQTVRENEELIYDQRQGLAVLQAEKQTLSEGLIEAKGIIERERGRAERAEHRLRLDEARIRDLEEESLSLRSHLNSLMSVVHGSLSVGDFSIAAGFEMSA